MQEIGQVLEIWRYPVSSVSGQMLRTVEVSPAGVAGDRRFGLFERASGRPAAPEQEPKWRPALHLCAEQCDKALPTLSIPGSAPLPLDHPSLAGRLTDYFGFEVDIAAHDGPAGGADWLFPIIPGRYVVSPLHLVTTASLSALSTATGLNSVDRRRFRPSILIETNQEGYVENDWLGQALRIGTIDVSVSERTRRCGMTLVSQPGIDEEPNVLRGIMRHNARSLGVYANPLGSGAISVGDPVYAGI
ncbi:MAG TPA: MOSC N-terminal beta barrel domain-containing protein [Pseudorhizobium sp.]|jgi:hypothetical protein|nr:MOSC N-terminal beta barrel domain-containing protein [Pseudorhizobium sp.]